MISNRKVSQSWYLIIGLHVCMISAWREVFSPPFHRWVELTPPFQPHCMWCVVNTKNLWCFGPVVVIPLQWEVPLCFCCLQPNVTMYTTVHTIIQTQKPTLLNWSPTVVRPAVQDQRIYSDTGSSRRTKFQCIINADSISWLFHRLAPANNNRNEPEFRSLV